ncbi:MAG TPA: GntR family transcriptional regulator [Bacillota bacterium]|nr:GntR family transcriptional regulator [Bacillota bacterium]
MRKYKTKVEIIYEVLKESIITGIYKPGDRITIAQVAKDNEVSEIPVRESLRMLESEGLIDIKPNIGPVVSIISEEDILEQFEIRGVLEGYATRQSIDNLEESDLLELESIVGKMKAAIEEQDFQEYGELNRMFHSYIHESCGNLILSNMITDLLNRWERNRSVFYLAPQRSKESLEEHYRIIELIKEKKGKEVEEFVRIHKQKSALKLIEYLKQNK